MMLVELGTGQTSLALPLNRCVMSDKDVLSLRRAFLSIKRRLQYLPYRAALEITGVGPSSAQESYYYYHDLEVLKLACILESLGGAYEKRLVPSAPPQTN